MVAPAISLELDLTLLGFKGAPRLLGPVTDVASLRLSVSVANFRFLTRGVAGGEPHRHSVCFCSFKALISPNMKGLETEMSKVKESGDRNVP